MSKPSDIAVLGDLLRQTYTEACQELEGLKFDKSYPQHLYSVCLYASLLELSASIIVLYEKEQLSAVPIILRAIFEPFVDLRNLLDCADYVNFMYISHLTIIDRAIKGVHNDPTGTLAKLFGTKEEIDGLLKKNKAEVETLKSKGYRSLSVRERFERAGLLSDYRSLYAFLSTEAHSGPSALERRHIRKSGNDYEVVIFDDPAEENKRNFLDISIALLLRSSIELHKLFQSPGVSKFQLMMKKLEKIRLLYSETTP
jgi:hypothetical protein